MTPLRPVLNFPPALLLRAQPVRVVFFDVDGVLTDGGLYFSESGETLKRFHTLDGHGIKLLQRAGITPAVITGRDSPALRLRLQALARWQPGAWCWLQGRPRWPWALPGWPGVWRALRCRSCWRLWSRLHCVGR